MGEEKLTIRNRFIRSTTIRGGFQGLRSDDEIPGLRFSAVSSRLARRHSSVARFRTLEGGLGVLKECIMKN